jgi:hypothetical protein
VASRVVLSSIELVNKDISEELGTNFGT